MLFCSLLTCFCSKWCIANLKLRSFRGRTRGNFCKLWHCMHDKKPLDSWSDPAQTDSVRSSGWDPTPKSLPNCWPNWNSKVEHDDDDEAGAEAPSGGGDGGLDVDAHWSRGLFCGAWLIQIWAGCKEDKKIWSEWMHFFWQKRGPFKYRILMGVLKYASGNSLIRKRGLGCCKWWQKNRKFWGLKRGKYNSFSQLCAPGTSRKSFFRAFLTSKKDVLNS